MTQVAAAQELGVSLSTMKSRVQRGRAQLREALDRCCAISLDVRGHVTDVVPRVACRCA
jgi:RNA polymerase sigma-70 factor, ECF subfamily